MKKALLIVVSLCANLVLNAQQNLAVGLGLGNIIKTAANQYLPGFDKNPIWFDINLRYTNNSDFATHFEYTYIHLKSSQNQSNLTVNYVDLVHQPKLKVFYAPMLRSELFTHDIGASLTSNFSSFNRAINTVDAFGNSIKKQHQLNLNTMAIGLVYHLNLNIKRFTLVLETEVGKILDNSALYTSEYIYGYGFPLHKEGYYFNMDIELYYTFGKISAPNQSKKVNKNTYEFK